MRAAGFLAGSDDLVERDTQDENNFIDHGRGADQHGEPRRRYDLSGPLREIKNTGGDNFKIGQCQFTIDQYSGVTITNRCRIGQPCTVQAKVEKDNRAVWIKHSYRVVGPDASPATDLMDAARKADGICRGSTGDRKLVLEFCNIRADVSEALLKMGWCYGKHDQIGADMDWHRCTANSQRGPFGRYDPETD